MTVDLHIHTDASDGTNSPREVVLRARQKGLMAIAITDHDTINGVVPAWTAGRPFSLEVLSGVELSTEYQEREVHILGYLIDLNNHDFLTHLNHLQQYRKERIMRMVDKLRELHIPISREEVLRAGAGAVGRPHVARVLIEKGIVRSGAQAFEQYIGVKAPAYVPRYKYSPFEAIRLIHKAGGVPVLAHPSPDNSNELIPQLAEEGLQGVEVYYPGRSSWVKYYLEICRRYNLLCTGGSDYHGPDHTYHGELGSVTVSYSIIHALKNRTAPKK